MHYTLTPGRAGTQNTRFLGYTALAIRQIKKSKKAPSFRKSLTAFATEVNMFKINNKICTRAHTGERCLRTVQGIQAKYSHSVKSRTELLSVHQCYCSQVDLLLYCTYIAVDDNKHGVNDLSKT